MTLYSLAARALPADALCGLDEGEYASVDRLARAIEASGYGSAAAHRTAILRAIGEHLRTYDDAREALRWLASLDRRLAVWNSCVCAREVLRFVPEGEERPLQAIEATERWLAGLATHDEVLRFKNGAWKAWRDHAATADSATYSEAYSAYAAAYVAASTCDADVTCAAGVTHAATYAADAACAANDLRNASAWDVAHAAERTRLVAVIADALPGLPEETA